MASTNQGPSVNYDGTQKLIDPAQGIVGNPSSLHGSYAIWTNTKNGGPDQRDTTISAWKSPGQLPYVGAPTPLPYLDIPQYQMRRSDTAQSSGYSFWVNLDGSSDGAPSSAGTVGPATVLFIFYNR